MEITNKDITMVKLTEEQEKKYLVTLVYNDNRLLGWFSTKPEIEYTHDRIYEFYLKDLNTDEITHLKNSN